MAKPMFTTRIKHPNVIKRMSEASLQSPDEYCFHTITVSAVKKVRAGNRTYIGHRRKGHQNDHRQFC